MPSIDYRVDIYAFFTLLGIVQAIFLSFFYLAKRNRKYPVNLYQGIAFISIAFILIEIFALYTGYVQSAFWLVDFSESFGFLIGPIFFAIVWSMIYGNISKKFYWHFVPFVFYSLYLIPFLLLPDVAKYNAYIGAYHPELPFVNYDYPYDTDILGIRDEVSLLTLISVFIYGLLCTYHVVKVFKEAGESIFKTKKAAWQALRLIPFYVLTVFVAVLVVKLTNLNDTGDHIFAAYISLTVYIATFVLLKNSTLFAESVRPEEKYKTSKLTEDNKNELLQKLDSLLTTEKLYKSSNCTLPGLAARLNTSVHLLSQGINDGLKKSYFEMIADYRVEEAKRLLKAEETKFLKLEEIAEMVGYNSKSSFNTAFKKITGVTPSTFRDA